MSNLIKLEPRAGYILATLPPNLELTGAVLQDFWPAVTQLCQRYGVTKVLSVGPKPTRRMSTMDAYDSGVLATAIPMGLKVAFCWEGYVTDHLTHFFQSVASNRGTMVEFFPNAAAGMAWLDIEDAELAAEKDPSTTEDVCC